MVGGGGRRSDVGPQNGVTAGATAAVVGVTPWVRRTGPEGGAREMGLTPILFNRPHYIAWQGSHYKLETLNLYFINDQGVVTVSFVQNFNQHCRNLRKRHYSVPVFSHF